MTQSIQISFYGCGAEPTAATRPMPNDADRGGAVARSTCAAPQLERMTLQPPWILKGATHRESQRCPATGSRSPGRQGAQRPRPAARHAQRSARHGPAPSAPARARTAHAQPGRAARAACCWLRWPPAAGLLSAPGPGSAQMGCQQSAGGIPGPSGHI